MSSSRRLWALGVLVAVAATVAGCAAAGASPVGSSPVGPVGTTQAPSSPTPTTRSDRVAAPIQPDLVSGEMVGAACPFNMLNPHVSGTLVADQGDSDWPVRLDDSGRRAYVRWPTGFAVTFPPGGTAQLLDERGSVAATAGQMVELPQVGPGSHRGTPDDPYVAAGLTFGRCYVVRPGASTTPASAMALAVQNGTTLRVSIFVNGMLVRVVDPGACLGCRGDDAIPASELPNLSWSVEARTSGGRVLSSLTVDAGDVVNGPGANGGTFSLSDAVRVDLSCGRLDMWVGSPMAGPMPGPGKPGDCAP